jgi:hypothetical protein
MVEPRSSGEALLFLVAERNDCVAGPEATCSAGKRPLHLSSSAARLARARESSVAAIEIDGGAVRCRCLVGARRQPCFVSWRQTSASPLHTVGSPRFRVVDADPCGSQQINWLLSRNFACSVVTIGRAPGGSGAAKCVGVRFRSFLWLYFFFFVCLFRLLWLCGSLASRSPEATRPPSVQHQQHTTAPHHRPAHTTRAPYRVGLHLLSSVLLNGRRAPPDRADREESICPFILSPRLHLLRAEREDPTAAASFWPPGCLILYKRKSATTTAEEVTPTSSVPTP